MSTTISTGLFNASGALTAPVINANTVNVTNPVRYINATAVPSQTIVSVKPSTVALAGKVLVVQGGTQTSGFNLCCQAAAQGAHVYALARTKFWFDQDVEAYNYGMFTNNPELRNLDASAGLIQGVYTNNDASANVLNDRLPTFTFPGGGFVKFIEMDGRVAYLEKTDPNPTAHAGYTDPSGKPWLRELIWFSVDTSGARNFGKACPCISVRGALTYIMQKELYITEVMVLGGAGDNYISSCQGIYNNHVYSFGTEATVPSDGFSIIRNTVGSENMYNEIVNCPDFDPMKMKDLLATTYGKVGCTPIASMSSNQLYVRSAMASEVYKLQFSNVDASGKIIGIRVGQFGSNSGKGDHDGIGDSIRVFPYNLQWKLCAQLNKQLATQGVQLGMTTFFAGVGGLNSKSIGSFYFQTRVSMHYGWALDLSAYLANGSVVGLSIPTDHFNKLNNLNGNPSYDVNYFNLHNPVAYLTDTQGRTRICFKNYTYDASNNLGAGGSTLTPAQWLADQTVATITPGGPPVVPGGPPSLSVSGGTWIDALLLSRFTGFDLAFSFTTVGLLNPAQEPVPGNAATQLSQVNYLLPVLYGAKVKICPLAFAIALNGNAANYGASVQLKTPIATAGTMQPVDVGARLFQLLYNNVPLSTGQYIDMDGSSYQDCFYFTNNPLLRFNLQSTNGLLPYLVTTLPWSNGGALTKSSWKSVYNALQNTPGFDFTSNNPYNPNGRAPVLGL